MPPKFKFTREEIIQAALDLTRESGIAAVTARGLGAKLGSSVKPIFSLFENMEEVQNEVLKAAEKLSQVRIRETMESGQYPPYKASGIAYICFAREEKELFKLLYMRDRSRETFDEGDSVKPLIEVTGVFNSWETLETKSFRTCSRRLSSVAITSIRLPSFLSSLGPLTVLFASKLPFLYSPERISSFFIWCTMCAI